MDPLFRAELARLPELLVPANKFSYLLAWAANSIPWTLQKKGSQSLGPSFQSATE